jgi:type II restriction/modification system DNA methylase subunit YeeA
MNVFEKNASLSEQVSARNGMTTGDNERFLRFWQEVGHDEIVFGASSTSAAAATGKRWFPHNKGGAYRKWYGNAEYVVDWLNDGEAIKDFRPKSTVRNPDYFFKASVSWSDINMKTISFRYYPEGFCFDAAVNSAFPKDRDHALSLLAVTNNKFVFKMAPILNPTMHFKIGDFGSLPGLLRTDSKCTADVQAMLDLSKTDWDNFETSWDFRDQPLLRPGLKGATLEASWRNWEAQSTAAIRRMRELETENNRLFIAAYGLEGELQPEVPEDQITLARADARKDMAAFLSYAVGCMMGRYSPDHPGLILANAGDSAADFRLKLAAAGLRMNELSFQPDEDGIIPVLDGEWFEDDIVARTRDFLRATFGEATLRENLRFIEDALGKDLRKYFLTDFYKDHLQTYKKRPIYWLVQSPKKGFSALLYLHRCTRDTMNGVLNRYLRDYQVKLRNRITHLAEQEATATSAKAKTEARKEGDKLKKTLHECEEWERQTLLPLAQARIELDLDDGVKVNYLKLGEALAPIPGLAAKED